MTQNKTFEEFLELKKKYYQNVKIDPSLTEYKQELEQLVEEGIVILEGFFPESQVKPVYEAGLKLFERWKEAYPDGNEELNFFNDTGYSTIDPCENHLPITIPFFENEELISILRAYSSSKTASFRRSIKLRTTLGGGYRKEDFQKFYHFDKSYGVHTKFFIYLNDVDEKNGALRFLRGSHKQDSEWRLPKEYEYFTKYVGTEGESVPQIPDCNMKLGGYSDKEVKMLIKKFNFRELTVVGPMGTVILFNAGDGLHKAGRVISGHREILANHFRL